MNAAPLIVTGDHAYFQCPLILNGRASPDLTGATVTAAITDEARTQILAGPITLSDATPGSDWPNRVVVTTFDGTHTAGLTPGARVTVEVQAVEGSIKTTWFATVPVVRGLLP